MGRFVSLEFEIVRVRSSASSEQRKQKQRVTVRATHMAWIVRNIGCRGVCRTNAARRARSPCEQLQGKRFSTTRYGVTPCNEEAFCHDWRAMLHSRQADTPATRSAS